MKTIILSFLLAIIFSISSYSQSSIWSQIADCPTAPRYGSTAFSIGNYGYLCFGNDFTGSGGFNDLWQYDPSSNTWSQKTSCPGGTRFGVSGFEVNGKGYICLGWLGTTLSSETWEYDPLTNSWAQKANFPGTPRAYACSFSIGNCGYIVSGDDGANNIFADIWSFNPDSNSWHLKTSFSGIARQNGVGFSLGSKGYICSGALPTMPNPTYKYDLWEYDKLTDSWLQKATFPGLGRHWATGFSIGNSGYIGIGNSELTGSPCSDFWEYDLNSDSWIQRADYGGGNRTSAIGFSIGSYGYIGTGTGPTNQTFWKFGKGDSTTTSVKNDEELIKLNIWVIEKNIFIDTKAPIDESLNFVLFDIQGRIIKEKELINYPVCIKNIYCSGIYFYKITSNNKIVDWGRIILQ